MFLVGKEMQPFLGHGLDPAENRVSHVPNLPGAPCASWVTLVLGGVLPLPRCPLRMHALPGDSKRDVVHVYGMGVQQKASAAPRGQATGSQ